LSILIIFFGEGFMVSIPIKQSEGRTTTVTIIRDLPYATQSSAQKLDIYMAAGIEKPRPVIVWIHPGGFIAGDKGGNALGASFVLARVNMISLVLPMLERGYSVVSVNHRLSEEAIFPACVYDIKAAIRWVKANAAKFHFDPDRVVSWGSSSGGYFAALMATSADVKELEDLSMGNPEYSSRVVAAIDWFGPTDFLTMDPHHLQLGQEAHVHEPTSHESLLMGASVTSIPEKCRLASPITHVDAKSAPIYIQQGTGDPVIPYPQSQTLADKLAAAIGKENVGLDLVPNVGHADSCFFTEANINKMLDFVDKYTR
jgi:acetyl esterase/lipase